MDTEHKENPLRGYVDWFYEVADMLDIARPQAETPKNVWEQQMRPKLQILTTLGTRYERALLEYPLRNPQLLQANKVCKGVQELAISYTATKDTK